jgi:Ni/Co efflux regulator RcnB
MRIFLTILLFVVLFLAPMAAYASPNNGKEWKQHTPSNRKHRDHNSGSEKIVIRDSERTIIRKYIASDYRTHCPPGLAKKHTGCLPPGQAKKRYVIGKPLSKGILFESVPQALLAQLQPIPAGYQYMMVDRDVLLISEASKQVIDAITLLSAVRK